MVRVKYEKHDFRDALICGFFFLIIGVLVSNVSISLYSLLFFVPAVICHLLRRKRLSKVLSRKAQGIPVNMIVITALALLVLVIVGAYFISGFGNKGIVSYKYCKSFNIEFNNMCSSECGFLGYELNACWFNDTAVNCHCKEPEVVPLRRLNIIVDGSWS